jgi:predicted enzyme related to lactoylglutathione lyase
MIREEVNYMTDSPHPSSAFCWVELITNDENSASAFYAELLDWEIKEENMPYGTYRMVKAGGQYIASMIPTSSVIPSPMWVGTIAVSDINAIATKAEQLGGTIIIPLKDEPGLGRTCVIRDPQGAITKFVTMSQA